MGRTPYQPFSLRRPGAPFRRGGLTSRSAPKPLIDEKLIEGSQVSRFFSQSDRVEPQHVDSRQASFPAEGDFQLDAFGE